MCIRDRAVAGAKRYGRLSRRTSWKDKGRRYRFQRGQYPESSLPEMQYNTDSNVLRPHGLFFQQDNHFQVNHAEQAQEIMKPQTGEGLSREQATYDMLEKHLG